MDEFLNDFFDLHETESFHLTKLIRESKDFFDVTDEDAAIRCDRAHGLTGPETTKLEQFTHWGCVHLLAAGIIKHNGPQEYRIARCKSDIQLLEATAFLRHARKIGFSSPDARNMVTDKWSAEILDKAAQVAYAEA